VAAHAQENNEFLPKISSNYFKAYINKGFAPLKGFIISSPGTLLKTTARVTSKLKGVLSKAKITTNKNITY